MAATSRITGKNLVVVWQSGGSEYILSGDQTSLDITGDTNLANLTAGDDDYAYNEATHKTNSASLTSMFIGTDGTATFGQAQRGDEGTILYGVDGTAVGKPKGGFPAVVKTKNVSAPFDGAVTRMMTFEGQGGVYGTSVFDPDIHAW